MRFAFHADWTDVRAVCSGSSLDCLDMGLCVYKFCSIGSCLASALFVRSFVLNCSMTGDELRSLFALTGVDDSLKEYVITAGVQSVLVFSRIGITEQEIRDRVVKHWVETLPSPVEPLRVIVAEAAILAAWDLANTQRLKTIQADTVPAPVFSAPSLPSSSSASTIPTFLRPGVWAEQILKFQTQWNPREFPVKVLLGSEAILARLLHEATVSRPDYTQEDYGRSWSSQEWKSGAAEHDRSGKLEEMSWVHCKKLTFIVWNFFSAETRIP